jgi:hypothetical protein
VVSASKCSREVEESKSRGVVDPEPTATVVRGPLFRRCWRVPQRLDSSTYRLRNRGNKARMSMKTNSRGVEEPRSRGVVEPKQEVDGRMPTACHSSTLNSRLLDLNSTEQSENVYENKRQVQKVTELLQCQTKRRPHVLVPQAGRRRLTPRLLDSYTCRSRNQRNKARMSMKTNSRGVEEPRSREVVKPKQEVDGRMPTACHSSTLNSRLLDLNSTEQSENVYENKGQVQKVAAS